MKHLEQRNIIDLTTNARDDVVIMNMKTYRNLLTELGEDQTAVPPASDKTHTACAEIFDCPKKLATVSRGTHYGIGFPVNN